MTRQVLRRFMYQTHGTFAYAQRSDAFTIMLNIYVATVLVRIFVLQMEQANAATVIQTAAMVPQHSRRTLTSYWLLHFSFYCCAKTWCSVSHALHFYCIQFGFVKRDCPRTVNRQRIHSPVISEPMQLCLIIRWLNFFYIEWSKCHARNRDLVYKMTRASSVHISCAGCNDDGTIFRCSSSRSCTCTLILFFIIVRIIACV